MNMAQGLGPIAGLYLAMSWTPLQQKRGPQGVSKQVVHVKKQHVLKC